MSTNSLALTSAGTFRFPYRSTELFQRLSCPIQKSHGAFFLCSDHQPLIYGSACMWDLKLEPADFSFWKHPDQALPKLFFLFFGCCCCFARFEFWFFLFRNAKHVGTFHCPSQHGRGNTPPAKFRNICQSICWLLREHHHNISSVVHWKCTLAVSWLHIRPHH